MTQDELGESQEPVTPRSAADYLASRDGEARIIFSEMAESAAIVARAWTSVAQLVTTNPDEALTALIEAKIRLESFLPIEVEDGLRIVQELATLIDRELPDDPG